MEKDEKTTKIDQIDEKDNLKAKIVEIDQKNDKNDENLEKQQKEKKEEKESPQEQPITQKRCNKCGMRIDWYCICWRDHWNSTFNIIKRRELVQLVQGDVWIKDALAYVTIPISTYQDWIKKDKNLLEEIERAKKHMDVLTSNTIAYKVKETKDEKLSMERKKRRDIRYRDRVEVNDWLDSDSFMSQGDRDKINDIISNNE